MLKIGQTISKAAANIANSKCVKNHITKSIENPKYLLGALIATSVSKDLFGHANRVIEDKKNKDIPENKKRFMTIMDATMGITTGLVQLSTAALVSSKKIQNFLSKKLFSSLGENTKAFKTASNSLMILSTLTAATVLAKRLLVPTIATPIAGKIAKNAHEKTPEHHINESIEDLYSSRYEDEEA